MLIHAFANLNRITTANFLIPAKKRAAEAARFKGQMPSAN
jgi:hypothetical protein